MWMWELTFHLLLPYLQLWDLKKGEFPNELLSFKILQKKLELFSPGVWSANILSLLHLFVIISLTVEDKAQHYCRLYSARNRLC